MYRSRNAAVAAALAAALTAGCAIRYDAAGVTRVGIGLWGFGDPPGVHWNLDWPHREVPDLPVAPRRELSPYRDPVREPGAVDLFAPSRDTSDRHAPAIDDNRACASRFALPSPQPSVASRADDRVDGDRCS